MLWVQVRQGLLLFCSGFFSVQAVALPLDPARLASELKMNPQTIRVRLSGLGRVMTIKGEHLALSLAKRPDLGNVQSEEWIIDCKRSLIHEPSTQKSRQIPRSGILIESLSGVLSLNQRNFRDQLVVYPKELLSPYDESVRNNSECLVVNHIDLERYLESVVNGEFNSQWAEAAVEAQIIAARTYALFQMTEMRKDKGRVFDVESTQKDQVYLGLDRVDSKASELVAKTKGMILVPRFGKNEPIKAFYHASCGGRTITPEKVWGASFKGFGKGVRCPFCYGSPSYLWDYRLSFHELEKKIWNGISKDSLNRKFWPEVYRSNPNRWYLKSVVARGDRPKAIKMPIGALIAEAQAGQTADLDQGHIKELHFEFLDREDIGNTLKVKMDAYAARNWIDPSRLKSTWYEIMTKGRSILFRGKGSGHGVGMCQWGAKNMGEKGFTRDQILLHYYPGVKIARISK
ncbi:MAG: SpoIID/LytB domain-containing protein [Bdellovibrionales bacterium]|nr:SpoIID/LytB domain-containing protein [Bdellovibrionales bacterium]